MGASAGISVGVGASEGVGVEGVEEGTEGGIIEGESQAERGTRVSASTRRAKPAAVVPAMEVKNAVGMAVGVGKGVSKKAKAKKRTARPKKERVNFGGGIHFGKVTQEKVTWPKINFSSGAKVTKPTKINFGKVTPPKVDFNKW
jgi:hypothetical protein